MAEAIHAAPKGSACGDFSTRRLVQITLDFIQIELYYCIWVDKKRTSCNELKCTSKKLSPTFGVHFKSSVFFLMQSEISEC